MQKNLVRSFGVALLLLGAKAGFADEHAAVGLLRWQDADVVAEGATLYGQHCASCHGAELEGAPNWRERDAEGYLPAPPHDETGHTWHHADEILIAITTHGTAALVGGDYRTNMMGFGEVMTEDEIIAVLSYIKSTWPEEAIEIHNEINAGYGG